VSPKEVVLGMGIWRPDGPALRRIRDRIDKKRKAWTKARDDKRMRAHFELGGESLKRPPQGFDKDHPLLEDLKRKDFVGFCTLKPDAILDRKFPDRTLKAFASAKPFMKYLCAALDLPF
jgi:uncharacterized protein (TIGR02453 family)